MSVRAVWKSHRSPPTISLKFSPMQSGKCRCFPCPREHWGLQPGLCQEPVVKDSIPRGKRCCHHGCKPCGEEEEEAEGSGAAACGGARGGREMASVVLGAMSRSGLVLAVLAVLGLGTVSSATATASYLLTWWAGSGPSTPVAAGD